MVSKQTIMPRSEQAEAAILSKALRDGEASLEAVSCLSPQAFYDDRNKTIFEAITSLVKENATVDLLTVTERAKGVSSVYISELFGSGLDVGARIPELAEIIKQTAEAREIIKICSDVSLEAYSGEKEILEKLTSKIFKLTENKVTGFSYSEKELIPWYFDLLNKRSANDGSIGIPFGFADLEAATHGARPGHFILIAGRPSQGKSAFLENLVTNFLENNKSVYFVSAESSREEVLDRVFGRLTKLGHSSLIRGLASNSDKWPAVNEQLDKFNNYKLTLNDNPNITTSEILIEANRLKLKGRCDVILVDYLQFVKDRADGENEERRVARISNNLKTLARSLQVPVIAACQLNRQPEGREDKAPKLIDLRQSGQLEMDADIVLALWRESEISNVTNFRILKQRSGKLAEFQLKFEGNICRFDNLSLRDYAEEFTK